MSSTFVSPSSRMTIENIITLIAAVDGADLVLLSASFHAFEKDFGFSPRQLGLLSGTQYLAMCICLPLWPPFIVSIGYQRLLLISCFVWGLCTFMTPNLPSDVVLDHSGLDGNETVISGPSTTSIPPHISSTSGADISSATAPPYSQSMSCTSFLLHFLLRFVNGAALSAIIPLAQALLADIVPAERRGVAFGRMGAASALAKVIVSYYVISSGPNWSHGWYLIGISAFLLMGMIYFYLPRDLGKDTFSSHRRLQNDNPYENNGLADRSGQMIGSSMENIGLEQMENVESSSEATENNDSRSLRNNMSNVSIANSAARERCSPSRSQSKPESFLAVVKKIVMIPSFIVLVLQGVAGGTPWQTMGFINLYLLNLGLSNTVAASINSFAHLGAIPGNLFGGWIGDKFAQVWGKYGSRISGGSKDSEKANNPLGRVLAAQISVFLGIPLWWAFFKLPTTGKPTTTGIIIVTESPGYIDLFFEFGMTTQLMMIGFTFFLIASWCPVAANRPICAELMSDPAERAQVVSMWILVEGFFSSILGAPVVGLLTESFGYKLDNSAKTQGSSDQLKNLKNADAVGSALTGLGIICWSICGLFWCFMYRTLPRDLEMNYRGVERGTYDDDIENDLEMKHYGRPANRNLDDGL